MAQVGWHAQPIGVGDGAHAGACAHVEKPPQAHGMLMVFEAPGLFNSPLNRALFCPNRRVWSRLLSLPAAAGILCGPGWKEPHGRGWPVFCVALLPADYCTRVLPAFYERLWGGCGPQGGREVLGR
jgi:hypothetical protein